MNRPLRSILLGSATGMRSMAAPSQLGRHLRDRTLEGNAQGIPGAPLSPTLVRVLQIAAVLEMAGDKLAHVPDRTSAGPLFGRMAIGAISAAVLADRTGESQAGAAVLGGFGAAVGAFIFFHLRRSLTKVAGLPDLPVALAEDVLAIATARQALRG